MAAIEPTRDIEDALFRAGTPWVIGVDEVGRGAIAAHAAVGACLLLPSSLPHPDGLRDSKLLSEKRREALYPQLLEWAPGYHVGYASANEIDTLGITRALALAGTRAVSTVLAAVANLGLASGGAILLDGSHDWLGGNVPTRVITRVKADRDCVSVSAASVLAKVERDRQLIALHDRFPQYHWASNKGYGSPNHYAALATHGAITGVHRMTWLPAQTPLHPLP
jgi:ribonuclease HII